MKAIDEELFRAVKDADVDAVRAALRAGADVNVRDKYDCTPIFCVAEGEYGEEKIAEMLEVADVLLAAGCDLEPRSNICGETPLLLAVNTADVKVLRWFIEKGADVSAVDEDGVSALHFATLNSAEPERTELLLNAGAPVNLRVKDVLETPLDWAYTDIAACPGEMSERTAYLLREHGAIEGAYMEPMGQPEDTPEARMLAAIDAGDMEKFMCALNDGADINAKSARYSDVTALMKAARFGRIEMVRELLARGTDTALRDNEGDDALEYSIHSNSAELTHILLQQCGDGQDRSSLLLVAASNGYDRATHALLQAGLDPNIRNNRGDSPLDLAFRYYTPNTGYAQTIEYLRLYGAKAGRHIAEPS